MLAFVVVSLAIYFLVVAFRIVVVTFKIARFMFKRRVARVATN
jgi:hypothetical protein